MQGRLHHHDDEEPALGIEHFESTWLTTVGIDIGSSGTQVLFSRLRLRRMGAALSSRYAVVSREQIFASDVMFTPYLRGLVIDEKAVTSFIKRAYRDAGLRRGDVDTGVVILTGEAIRRRNARSLADSISSTVGDFICVAAGHRLEALLAAHGSGAVKESRDSGTRLLSVDMGGGTTKIAVVDGGRVTGTSALRVGGRLLVTDKKSRVVRLEPAAARVAKTLGISIRTGRTTQPEDIAAIAGWMAEALEECITTPKKIRRSVRQILLEPLPDGIGDAEGVVFSGGVAEYVYGLENRNFNDLGKALGGEIRRKIGDGTIDLRLLPAAECIRATVTGVSQYTIQVSGETIYMSRKNLTPLRNVQVIRPDYKTDEVIDARSFATKIRLALELFEVSKRNRTIALTFSWAGEPSYERLRALAAGIMTGTRRLISATKPLVIVTNGDIAQTLGAILKEEMRFAPEIVSLDGISLENFDYLDIGRLIEGTHAVPVTIKSLLFKPR